MFIWIAALARNIRQSREGAVAIQMALIFTALMGTGALASEIGFALYKHRQMQSAADAAAYGAAIAKSTGYPATIATEAYADAAAVGFVNGANGVTITVNNPPASGPNTANQSAVEVIIQQPQTLTVVGAVNSPTGFRPTPRASSIWACAQWRRQALVAPAARRSSSPIKTPELPSATARRSL